MTKITKKFSKEEVYKRTILIIAKKLIEAQYSRFHAHGLFPEEIEEKAKELLENIYSEVETIMTDELINDTSNK